MLLMAVSPQKRENDEEHLFIVKNDSIPLFVSVFAQLFLIWFSQSFVCSSSPWLSIDVSVKNYAQLIIYCKSNDFQVVE